MKALKIWTRILKSWKYALKYVLEICRAPGVNVLVFALKKLTFWPSFSLKSFQRDFLAIFSTIFVNDFFFNDLFPVFRQKWKSMSLFQCRVFFCILAISGRLLLWEFMENEIKRRGFSHLSCCIPKSGHTVKKWAHQLFSSKYQEWTLTTTERTSPFWRSQTTQYVKSIKVRRRIYQVYLAPIVNWFIPTVMCHKRTMKFIHRMNSPSDEVEKFQQTALSMVGNCKGRMSRIGLNRVMGELSVEEKCYNMAKGLVKYFPRTTNKWKDSTRTVKPKQEHLEAVGWSRTEFGKTVIWRTLGTE